MTETIPFCRLCLRGGRNPHLKSNRLCLFKMLLSPNDATILQVEKGYKLKLQPSVWKELKDSVKEITFNYSQYLNLSVQFITGC